MKRAVVFRVAILAALIFSGVAAAQFQRGPKMEYTASVEPAAAGGTVEAQFAFKITRGWHVNANKPRDPSLIPTEFTLEPPEGLSVAEIIYPDAIDFTPSFQTTPLAVYGEKFTIKVRIKLADTLAGGAYTLNGKLKYQPCNDETCSFPASLPVTVQIQVGGSAAAPAPVTAEPAAAPETPAAPEAVASDASPGALPAALDRFALIGRESGYKQVDAFLGFLDDAEAGRGLASEGFEGQSVWVILLLVLGGGLALNLTPCVLPLIPINIAIIGAGARSGSRKRGFLLGATYGAGIALVYGALGLAVVLGLSSVFGAINASPWFNGAIALLFVVLALAMFDVIIIDFSKYQANVGPRNNEKGSFLVALFMGTVSALLAGACVAPVVISTIVFSQKQYQDGVTWALLLPFLLGAGMALPWPFAGAGLSFLPKPGMWMVRVKQVFGVFILVFAGYYGYHAATGFSDRYLVDEAAVEQSVAQADAEGWRHELAPALDEALAQNKPVLIDFWATWCKNCLVMNTTTFKDAKVLERLGGYVKVKFQAEDLDASPAKEALEHFEVKGLPTYIVLKPKS